MALTDLAIRHARRLDKAYRLSDCHGLYLQVNPSGSKLWYLKFRFENKENRMALGPYPLISLAQAREKQAEIRRFIYEGVNPAEKRGGLPHVGSDDHRQQRRFFVVKRHDVSPV